MNNYERIKSMTVDEMAEWLNKVTTNPCKHLCNRCTSPIGLHCDKSFKQWLLSEVTND